MSGAVRYTHRNIPHRSAECAGTIESNTGSSLYEENPALENFVAAFGYVKLVSDFVGVSVCGDYDMEKLYDKNSNHLQVLELKYKIPVDSERDIVNLDEMLEKAYAQLEWAKQYVAEHEGILEEYFGTEYIGVIPNVVDYFVVTNYAIGTGTNCKLPSPILLEEHYLQLMQQAAGMQYVHKALLDKKKCIVGEIKKRYARYALVGFKIKIPETIMEEKGEIEFPLTCMNYF